MSTYDKISSCLQGQTQISELASQAIAEGDNPEQVRSLLEEILQLSEMSRKGLNEVLDRLTDLTSESSREELILRAEEAEDIRRERHKMERCLAAGLHVPSKFTQDEIVEQVQNAVGELTQEQQEKLRPYLCPKPVLHVRTSSVSAPPSETYYPCWTVAIFSDDVELISSDLHPGAWAVYSHDWLQSLTNYGQWREDLWSVVNIHLSFQVL